MQVSLYKKACHLCGVLPISAIYQSLSSLQLRLRHRALGSKDVKALALVLVVSIPSYHDYFSINFRISINSRPLTIRKISKSLKLNNFATIFAREIILTALFLSF